MKDFIKKIIYITYIFTPTIFMYISIAYFLNQVIPKTQLELTNVILICILLTITGSAIYLPLMIIEIKKGLQK